MRTPYEAQMDGDSRGVEMHYFNDTKPGGAECGIDTLRLSRKVIDVSCRNCIKTKRFTLAIERAMARQTASLLSMVSERRKPIRQR